ncbi:hypothetical protein JC221_185 [Yersinia phage JC221]|nr:hypothetical protein JC221_185 [Yersinia phage JC221]
MNDLYHVIYSGTVGIDEDLLCSASIIELKKLSGPLGKLKEPVIIYADHPADIEDVINSLDDRDIPCSYLFNKDAGVDLIVTFVLKGIDKTNPELLALFDRIKSN